MASDCGGAGDPGRPDARAVGAPDRRLGGWRGGPPAGRTGTGPERRQRAGPGGFVVGGVLRAYGTFDQPNPYGGYLGIHLPLILAAAIYARGSRRRWLAVLGIVVLAGIVASRSRGAWLGVGASSLVVALMAGRQASLRVRGAFGPGRRGGADRLACTPRRGV